MGCLLACAVATPASSLFAQAGDGIARVDALGRYIEVNDRCCQLLGRARGEIVGRYLSDMVVDVTPEYFAQASAQIAAASTATLESQMRHQDGSFSPVEITVAKNVGRQEYIAIVRDITERKRMEEALRHSEQNYREVYDHSPDMYLSGYPADHRIRDCNMTLAYTLGYTKEEIIGQPNHMLFDPASYARMREEEL